MIGISGVTSWLYMFEDTTEIMCGNTNFKRYVSTSFFPIDILGLLLIKSSNCFAQEQSFGTIFAVDFFFFFLTYE